MEKQAHYIVPAVNHPAMDPVHREVLDIHHSRLVTSLRANDVIDQLLKDDALSKYDYDQLKRTEAQGTRAMNRLLMLTLRRRGGKAYPALQQALNDSDQKELADVLRACELDLLEGLVTERLQRTTAAVSSYPSYPMMDLNGLLDTYNRVPTPLESQRSESPSPILQKASSPALKNPPTPRNTPKRKASQSPTPRATKSTSPSPSSKEEAMERERQLKQLEEDVKELRKSHSKMENELREQIQQLEKEKQAAQKKGGGCAVM